jgi:eukaryotic-like serine/threonine-protein kinase
MIAGRYEAKGLISGGGMGEIVECKDTHLDRPVILKLLPPGTEERRLVDEQKALVRVRSKHVVQLYDIVELPAAERKQKALVLEFIDGANLEPHSFEPSREYMKVLWQIACGLSEIHANSIIHRDIKPNNIRMDKEGVVKIIDFGLSRSSGAAAKTRSIIGTPVFMAPELWRDSTVSFDKSVDVYAFAVTAVALLKRKLPVEFRKQPPAAISATTLSSTLDGLPEDLISVLHQCLSFDIGARPRMDDVQARLTRHLLYNRHRALVVMSGETNQLDSKSRRITLYAAGTGSLTIDYDGFGFRVSSATGHVYLNNTQAQADMAVPGCCVITFGVGGSRRFVTFDVSNPEVMA